MYNYLLSGHNIINTQKSIISRHYKQVGVVHLKTIQMDIQLNMIDLWDNMSNFSYRQNMVRDYRCIIDKIYHILDKYDLQFIRNNPKDIFDNIFFILLLKMIPMIQSSGIHYINQCQDHHISNKTDCMKGINLHLFHYIHRIKTDKY